MMVPVDRAPPHMVISAEALVGALELVQGGGDQPAAGAARRMPQRDRLR